MERKLHLETLAVHGGQEVDPYSLSRAVPIYQTTSYLFRSTDHAARLFNLDEYGNIYSRIMNPTCEVFEKRMALLEGGVGALALGSGQAAAAFSIMNVASQGDHVVAAISLYGGTITLLDHTLRRFGVDTTFVDPMDPENIRQALKPNTKAVYAETIGNPRGDVLDIERVAAIAHAHGVPLIVDNTFATPVLCRPFDWGADIVVHSATKFIGGHGNSIGGVIVDSGRFDWTNGKFPLLTQPDPAYHGVRYVEQFGSLAFIVRARVTLLRDVGAPLSPFNAFLFLNGLETLHLRMERHCQNALRVAEFLEGHPGVAWVSHPGLPSHPTHHLARKYLPGGAGAVFTFGVKGGREAGRMFIESLALFSHLANVGDSKSLALHPASTTHQQMTAEQLQAAGVGEDMVRLSIGTEHVLDLLADLEQALTRVQAATKAG